MGVVVSLFDDDRERWDSPESFECWIETWASWLEGEHKSPATIRLYVGAADLLKQYAAGLGIGDVRDVTPAVVSGFLRELRLATSASTADTRRRGLVQFFRYLSESSVIPEVANPMRTVKAIRLDEKVPEIIPDDDIDALLKTCKGAGFEDRRDQAVIRLLLDTGGRRFEVSGIVMGAIGPDLRSIRVMGKGRKERDLFPTKKTRHALMLYIKTARSRHPLAHRPELWLGARGPLTGSGITQMLERRCDRAGIARVSPHQFRHTWAHKMKVMGRPEEDIMTTGGWGDRQMLRRYGRSASAERAKSSADDYSVGDMF